MNTFTQGAAVMIMSAAVWLPFQDATDIINVDVQPKPLKMENPVYPEEARKKHLEGTVWVKTLIDTTGKVSKAEILKSDHEILNEPSLQAARAWRFSPARKDNRPVAIWVTIPFKFKLSEGKGEKSKAGGPSDEAELLLKYTMDILNGKGSPQERPFVAPDAYLIDRGTSISLYDVVTGRAKDTLLEGEKERKSTFVNTKISEGGWTATVLVKTESADGGKPHWHTVNWEKGKDGVWTIRLWHASR